MAVFRVLPAYLVPVSWKAVLRRILKLSSKKFCSVLALPWAWQEIKSWVPTFAILSLDFR